MSPVLSIRARLGWSIVGSMLLIIGSISSWALLVTNHEAEEIFSARLATSARVLKTLTIRELGKVPLGNPVVIELPRELESDNSEYAETYGHAYESKIAFQIWGQSGLLLAKSASAPVERLGPLKAGFREYTLQGVTWHVFALASENTWILVAEKDEIRNEMTRDLTRSIFSPLLLGAVVLLLVVQGVALYSLRPLDTLARTLSQRDAQSLMPVHIEHLPRELQPVLTELNHLLDRVNKAMQREQGFIDSAAHELRTPIAAVQLHLQNALASQDPHEREQSLHEALTGVRRTAQMAEQLLAFSRVTASFQPQAFTAVDLHQVCLDVISANEPLLEQRGQSIAFEGHPVDLVQGDPYKLARLLQNLIDNASRHGQPHSEIVVQLKQTKHSVDLSVINEGLAIPDEEKQRIFEPYHRVLGTPMTGSGLGLAIVREIALQHHARLSVTDKNTRSGSVFTLHLPR
jgi:two-component system, OmpR family, sensor histidine kinase QseC